MGVRTVAIPHLQSSVSWWMLGLDSELVFVGDAGTTEAGRPSRRHGVELATYYSPRPWLVLDGDLSISRGRFRTSTRPATGFRGRSKPSSRRESRSTASATSSPLRVCDTSARAPSSRTIPCVRRRPASSTSRPGTSWRGTCASTVDIFNLLNARDSDIDYYYASRLPGEPAGGVNDIHSHPALPRTVRVGFSVAF